MHSGSLILSQPAALIYLLYLLQAICTRLTETENRKLMGATLMERQYIEAALCVCVWCIAAGVGGRSVCMDGEG